MLLQLLTYSLPALTLYTKFEKISLKLQVFDLKTNLRSQLFYENMKMRRCVQEFSPRPVPSKLIQNIIKSAGTQIIKI